MKKDKILFISHAEKDNELVTCFVNMLYQIGLKEEEIFCSSLPEVGVPIREDIYDYLRDLLDLDSIIPVFMLSENYYDSVACLNEMGAVWVKQKNNYFTFLLPGFEFKQIKGAINPNKKGIKLDDKESTLRGNLTCFKDTICELFGTSISNPRWGRQLDDFLNKLQNICPDLSIDIDDCQGYCIGEFRHEGCDVTIDKTLNKVIANVDFSVTNAELCSVVFFTGTVDAHRLFMANKTLKFSLRAKGDISQITIEPHLKTKNPTYNIFPDSDWQEYSIHLQDFKSKIDDWKNLTELVFFTERKFVSKCTIEISNIRIE